MKVHHITEAPKVEPTFNKLPKSVDIKPGVLDAKGNKGFNVVDQDGKVIKRFSGASAEADANVHRDKIKKQIKNAFGSQPRNQIVPDPKDDTKDKSKKSKGIKGLFEKAKGAVPEKLINWMRKHLSRLFGATVAGWVLKGFAISGIVSLYNSYFDEIYTLVEAKENGANDDVLKGIAKKMGSIRSKLIEETTNLMVGSIGMAFGTGGVLVGGMVVGAVATFFTGGAAAPPSILWGIFVGAVAAYGAYEGAMQVCKMESAGKLIGLDVSIYDYTKNKLGTTWLTPDMLADTLREVGAEQTFIKYVIGLTTNPLMQFSSPGAIPGINSGFSIGGAVSAPLGAVKDMIDHKDHSDLNRIMELSGVVQETKLKKIKLDDLPDELKKLAIIGAKTIQKANKEKKST
jgi:hypothetical protein